MIKLFRDIIKIYWKEHASKQIKVDKSKLLIFDEYLNKYVSADELLIPGEKVNPRSAVSLKKSKETIVFDLLLKKFVNPKLDLLSPQLKNLDHVSQCCSATEYKNFGSSNINFFWARKSLSKKKQLCSLPAAHFSGKVSVGNESSQLQKGWAGQSIKNPVTDPRPELGKPQVPSGSGKEPKKKERNKKKKRLLVCSGKVEDSKSDCKDQINKTLKNKNTCSEVAGKATIGDDISSCLKIKIKNPELDNLSQKSNKLDENKLKALEIPSEKPCTKISNHSLAKQDSTSIFKKICCKLFPQKTNVIRKNEDERGSSTTLNQVSKENSSSKNVCDSENKTASVAEAEKQISEEKQTATQIINSKKPNCMDQKSRKSSPNESFTPTQLYLCKAQAHDTKTCSNENKTSIKTDVKLETSSIKTKGIKYEPYKTDFTHHSDKTKNVNKGEICNKEKQNLTLTENETGKKNVSNTEKGKELCKSKSETVLKTDHKNKEGVKTNKVTCTTNFKVEISKDKSRKEEKSSELFKYNFKTKPRKIEKSFLNNFNEKNFSKGEICYEEKQDSTFSENKNVCSTEQRKELCKSKSETAIKIEHKNKESKQTTKKPNTLCEKTNEVPCTTNFKVVPQDKNTKEEMSPGVLKCNFMTKPMKIKKSLLNNKKEQNVNEGEICNKEKQNLTFSKNKTQRKAECSPEKEKELCKSKSETVSKINHKNKESKQTIKRPNTSCGKTIELPCTTNFNVEISKDKKTKGEKPPEACKHNIKAKPRKIEKSFLNNNTERNVNKGKICNKEKQNLTLRENKTEKKNLCRTEKQNKLCKSKSETILEINLKNKECKQTMEQPNTPCEETSKVSCTTNSNVEISKDKNLKERKSPEALKYNFMTKPMKIKKGFLNNMNEATKNDSKCSSEKNIINQKPPLSGTCNANEVDLMSKKDVKTNFKLNHVNNNSVSCDKPKKEKTPVCQTPKLRNKNSGLENCETSRKLNQKVDLEINTCKDMENKELLMERHKTQANINDETQKPCQLQQTNQNNDEKLDLIIQENSFNKNSDLSSCNSYMGFKVMNTNLEAKETEKKLKKDIAKQLLIECNKCLKEARMKKTLKKLKRHKKTASTKNSVCSENDQLAIKKGSLSINNASVCKEDINLNTKIKETRMKTKPKKSDKKDKTISVTSKCKDKVKKVKEQNENKAKTCLQEVEGESKLLQQNQKELRNKESYQSLRESKEYNRSKTVCSDSCKEKLNGSGQKCLPEQHDLSKNVNEKSLCPSKKENTNTNKLNCEGDLSKKEKLKKTGELLNKCITPKSSVHKNDVLGAKVTSCKRKNKSIKQPKHLNSRFKEDLSGGNEKNTQKSSLEKPCRRNSLEVKNDNPKISNTSVTKTTTEKDVNKNEPQKKCAYIDKVKVKKQLLKMKTASKENIQHINNKSDKVKLLKKVNQDGSVTKSTNAKYPIPAKICSKSTANSKIRQKTTVLKSKHTTQKTKKKVVKKYTSTPKICEKMFNKVNTKPSKQSLTKTKSRSISSLPIPQKRSACTSGSVPIKAKSCYKNQIIDLPVLAAKSTASKQSYINNRETKDLKPSIYYSLNNIPQTNNQIDIVCKVHNSSICQAQHTLLNIGNDTRAKLEKKLKNESLKSKSTWKTHYDQMNKLTDKFKNNVMAKAVCSSSNVKLNKINNEMKMVTGGKKFFEENKHKIYSNNCGTDKTKSLISLSFTDKGLKNKKYRPSSSNITTDIKREISKEKELKTFSHLNGEVGREIKKMSKPVTTVLEKLSQNNQFSKYSNNQLHQSLDKKSVIETLNHKSNTLDVNIPQKESSINNPIIEVKSNILDVKKFAPKYLGKESVTQKENIKVLNTDIQNAEIIKNPKIKPIKKLSIIKLPQSITEPPKSKCNGLVDKRLKKIAKKGQVITKKKTKEYFSHEDDSIDVCKTKKSKLSDKQSMFVNAFKTYVMKHAVKSTYVKKPKILVKKDLKKVTLKIDKSLYRNNKFLKLKKRVNFPDKQNNHLKTDNETSFLPKTVPTNEQNKRQVTEKQLEESVNKTSNSKTLISDKEGMSKSETLLQKSTKNDFPLTKFGADIEVPSNLTSSRKPSEIPLNLLPKSAKHLFFLNRSKTMPTGQSTIQSKEEKTSEQPQCSNSIQPEKTDH